MARDTAQSVVALGGGHGLFASLSALRRLVAELTLDKQILKEAAEGNF